MQRGVRQLGFFSRCFALLCRAEFDEIPQCSPRDSSEVRCTRARAIVRHANSQLLRDDYVSSRLQGLEVDHCNVPRAVCIIMFTQQRASGGSATARAPVSTFLVGEDTSLDDLMPRGFCAQGGKGTGGTVVMDFLKPLRDATRPI